MNLYTISVIASIAGGYLLFLGLFAILLRRLKTENRTQKKIILNQAKTKADLIKQDILSRGLSQLADHKEDFKEKTERKISDLEETRLELDAQQSSVDKQKDRLQKQEALIEKKQERLDLRKAKFEEVSTQEESTRKQYIERLGKMTQETPETVVNNIISNITNDRTIDQQRVIKLLEDELKDNAKKLATRMLHRTQSRYMPNFYWPKSASHIEIANQKNLDILSSDESTFLEDLKGISEDVNIELVIPEDTRGTPSVKFAGGFGVSKEACKLTFAELQTKHPNTWGKFKQTYDRYYSKLNEQALQLGQEAIRRLELQDMHPDLMLMIGQLNWRTSYRQNQYLHTFEVAELAGIMANELGVDPEAAKRCGLLHDIGKTIDYRIEGSHAVISADYADRFFETSRVCDAVLSHHNDLVLETPLAYVLKAADSLSGARPGARVNLEEGYQIRLSAIEDVARSFHGVSKVEIMNGGREVHIECNHKAVNDARLKELSHEIARKIEEDVAFPGQIKVLVTRKFEAVAVA